MFWISYLFLYVLYVLSPCYVMESNNTAVFVLDLKSSYEGEQTIFGRLSLDNLTQFSFIHLLANDKISFFFMDE
jgi:hypothetical protein